MTPQAQVSAIENRKETEVEASVRYGERFGLYELMARTGAVTVYGLARQALLPLPLACRWLEILLEAGCLHFDPFSACYRVWCEWPESPGKRKRDA
jgi:hypothetical protein